MMDNSAQILHEKDPILREMWSMGYAYYYEDHRMEKAYLCVDLERIKEVDLRELKNLIHGLKIISGQNMIDGSIHSWVSEADGSASRLRDFIKPEFVKE